MPVTHNVANSSSASGLSSISFNTTVAAGSNIAALIGIAWEELAAGAVIESVTFNGVAATFIQLVLNPGGCVEQYYAVGVTPGSRAVSVVWSDTVVAVVGLEVMNDVIQATPIGSIGTASGDPTAGPCTVTLTALTADSLLVDTLLVNQTTSVTPVTEDAAQDARWETLIGPDPTRHTGAGSTKLSGGGSTSMQWTIGASRRWDIAAVEFLFQPTDSGEPGIGGYTSYTYAADPTPLTSLRPPEEQQRVWVNDRRYMQGRT